MARATAKKLKLSRTINQAVNDDHPEAPRVPRASTTEYPATITLAPAAANNVRR
jgi:hypothetical protein